MIRVGRVVVPAAVAGALLLSTAAAGAQTAHVTSTTWRRGGDSDTVRDQGSPQHFAFELRFGAYSPRIDQEKYLPAGATPYKSVFNDNPMFYFGLEFDYLPLRIPWVGLIGPGFGWGRTRTSTAANFSDGPMK